MISPGQLSMLAGCAHKSAGELGDQYPSVFIEEAACLADKIAAAMRQPITAEALTAAGCVRDESWFDLPGSIVSVQQRDATTFDVYVIGYGASVPTKGVTTMYALGQLVELLGGGS